MSGSGLVAPLLRHGLAVVGAALVTLAIALFMEEVIATDRAKLGEVGVRHFVDFVRIDREEAIQRKERRREPPPPAEAPPIEIAPARRESFDPALTSVDIPAVSSPVDISIRGLGWQVLEGEYLPLVKIAPFYPQYAVAQGLEGHVIVEFTVTTRGTVRDVVVIEAEPKGVFEKSAIDAALKFKYRPRVVGGAPIEVRGVRNLFRFELTD